MTHGTSTARRRWVGLGALMVMGLGATPAMQSPASPDLTAALLSELIRLDTSNPPGKEGQVASLLRDRFERLGFDVEVIPTPEEGKAHLIARLRGDGSRLPVLLAAHADVVGVEQEKWTFPPFGGEIADGYVFGRGAIDFKGGMAVFAEAVMRLARERVPLARDVIFLAEADEEGGRYGTSWLAQEHWDKIACEFALNEGGWIIKRPEGGVRYVSISTADKGFANILLTARGTSTHSSMPQPDSAIFALARALARIGDYDTAPTLIPSTRQFFLTLAKTSQPPMSTYLDQLVNGTPEQVTAAAGEIGRDPLLHAIMRNTIAPVLVNAGFRGNVIPGSAEATINMRTIPGTDPEALVKELQAVVADPAVTVSLAPFPGFSAEEVAALLRELQRVEPSSQDTELYRALEAEAHALFPEAEVTPYLFQAGTDAFAWRSRGVPVYGIYPYPIDHDDLSRMHGNDERVSVESLRQGTDLIYRTLVRVAAKP